MKKIKILSALLILFAGFIFNSCDNEPIDDAINLDDFDTSCLAPVSFQASDFIGDTNVSLSWVAVDDTATWEIQYGIEGFQLGTGTSAVSTETNFTVIDLNSSNNYQFYIRTICSATSSSAWVGPISVNSINIDTPCIVPTEFMVTREVTNGTIINLNWIAGGEEDEWEVQYGPTGFEITTGTNVTFTNNIVHLSNMIVDQAYDFYIRSKCSSSNHSDWVGPISVEAGPTPVVPPTYMSATVNGTSYTQMKPTQYTFTGIKAKLDSSSSTGNKILFIQGNSNALSSTQDNFVEITLRIHQDNWLPETYILNKVGTTMPSVTVDLVIVNPTNTVTESELPGTLTITEFNPETKRIKGTFSFAYNLVSNANPPVQISGPFNVMNGAFDFEVEDAVFN